MPIAMPSVVTAAASPYEGPPSQPHEDHRRDREPCRDREDIREDGSRERVCSPVPEVHDQQCGRKAHERQHHETGPARELVIGVHATTVCADS